MNKDVVVGQGHADGNVPAARRQARIGELIWVNYATKNYILIQKNDSLCTILHTVPACCILLAMNLHQHSAQQPAPEEIAMRDALGAALEGWLAGTRLTQTAAAAVLGTTQARVSEIKHGKTAHFSLDLLVRLAARAGLQPQLSLAAPAPAQAVR